MDIAEEEYSAMDRADPAITEYLIEQTVQQVIQHPGKMEELDKFLVKSGMKNTPNAAV
jgi:nucleoside phosphorylase